MNRPGDRQNKPNKSRAAEIGAGTNQANQQRWRDGIAIVGMSARFPGCASVAEYWQRLVAGDSLLSKPTEKELSAARISADSIAGRHFVRSGTHLEGAESFDAEFFEFSPREAEIMDPQQRIFLECAYEALEHAGISGDGERVGVFAGTGMNTYMLQLLANPEAMAAAGGYQAMLGNDKDFLATRVAYKLNLCGPAVAAQTACSTSLAAVHLACQSLLLGECDSALAGGVSVMFPQVAGYDYIPGMILSPDGVCRPFDERARGTVPGKGAGVVVLKREADAVADGDTIYAVIGGSAWNNDGAAKAGYTAPSVGGQVQVIRLAQAAAGICADRISYVEAHGTGTELGDRIELAALAEAFGRRQEHLARCVLGSVKANMGHADVAAGVAGLIKTTLALHYGLIPATPHFEKANPASELERTPFQISATSLTWPTEETEHWAGVSSFGIGGTNVHVCLRSSGQKALAAPMPKPLIFNLSAKNESALRSSVSRLGSFLKASPEISLAAVAETLQRGRRTYSHRRAVVASNQEELLGLLEREVNKDCVTAAGPPVVAFLFPGQGQQFDGMVAGLYEQDVKFRAWIDRGLSLLTEFVPGPLAEEIMHTALGAGPHSSAGSRKQTLPTHVAQPLLFLVEYALAMRWLDAGVKPGLLVGHSLGELTAAATAGVFSFEDGLRLAARRGTLMQDTVAGAMLAVSLSPADVTPYLDERLWIAAENAPRLTVVSGSEEAISAAATRLSAARVATVRLNTDRAFHTPHLLRASAAFQQAVAAVERHEPRLPWLSNVTGSWITPEQATDPGYWAEQMTSKVLFAQNAHLLVKARCFLLEMGPGDALLTLVRQQSTEKSARSSASSIGKGTAPIMGQPGADWRAFLIAAAALWEAGLNVQWNELPGASKAQRRIALPTYPFERKRYWIEATQSLGSPQNRAMTSVSGTNELLKREQIASWFYVPSWQRTAAAALMLLRLTEMKSWLILGEGSGLAALLSSNLVQTGARVVLFVEDSNENLEQFWADNQFLRDGTVGLVNCWPVSASLPTAGDADGLHWRFISLLQSAQKARVRFRQIEIIADQLADVSGEKIEQPQRAVIEGLARILPAEYPGVSVRVIDPGPFDANTSNEELVGSVQNEIVTAPMSGIALSIAYRGHTRWQQIWQSVPLEAVSQSRFRAQGCYVITGGLGGVGYLCARYLLEKYGARVALIGRTKLPDQHRWEDWLTEHGSANKTSQRIQRAKALQQASGELLLLSADVADETAMATAWAAIEGRFGRVHGVIHAAGLPGGARISAQHQQSLAEILRPKVKGSQVLACLLRNKPVDFLLFCSSISAVVPIAGASDYAAANAFQDRYAAWCRQHLGIPAVSVNFDAWQELGMAAEMKTAPEFEHVKEARLKTAMTTPEALEALERVLASSETHVLVSTIDFVQVMRAAESASSAPESMTQLEQQEDQDSQTFDDSIELIETAAIVAIWRELLGVQSIASNDNFFELGGHSLLGTMVLARIRERFGVELTIRAIFEAPTPGELGLRVHEAKALQPTEGPFVAVGEREEFEI